MLPILRKHASAPGSAPRGNQSLSRVVHADGHLRTADGLLLYWQRWLPEAPRALLLIVHGLFEHGGRQLNLARYFTRRGWGCYAPDQRGHGRSGGRRVHVENFDEFLEDLRAARELVREQHAGLPLFLVGHSHGGLVALLLALRDPGGLCGLVLSSPLLGLRPQSGVARLLARLAPALARVWPSLLLPVPLDAQALSHDKLVVQAYSSDPLVGRKASPRWLLSAQAAMQEARDRAPALEVPTLVLAAGDDRVVDAAATHDWASAAPRALVEYARWDGLFHEIFNELEKEQVFRRMESWLEARL